MKTFCKSLMVKISPLVLALILPGAANAAYVCRLPQYDNFLSFRACASKKCDELLRLDPSTYVSIIGVSGKWYKVQLNNGAEGWVYGKYICN